MADSVERAKGARLLVIVPAYNEEGNIEDVVSRLKRLRHEDYECDFVVINDGSIDRTAEILDRLSVPHIDLVENLGIGGAMQTGYLYARQMDYDMAVQFDGDGQHDARYIEKIIAPLLAGEADIVIGSRFLGDESEFRSSAARRAGIGILSFILRVATGCRIRDITSGFRAANRRVIELFSNAYPIDYPEPESLASALCQGCSVREVPVAMHERVAGVSSISGLKSMYYMLKVGLSIVIAGVSLRRN